MSRRLRSESGQSTVEWIGLVLVVAAALTGLGALLGLAVPGAELARALAARMACGAGLDASCDAESDSGLAIAYGAEVATLLAERAPTIRYEDGMGELPVDFRLCRADPCSLASGSGVMTRTDAGMRATAFTHVVDCRPGAERVAGADCGGERAGSLYLQYWLYYPDSQTEPWGERGYHRDDWESVQLKLTVDGTALARASSHHSYNYEGGIRNWPSDAGIARKAGWGPDTGELHVSAGSHAGHVADDADPDRYTPGSLLRLVPLETLPEAQGSGAAFAVTPPWLKEVYRDPEAEGT